MGTTIMQVTETLNEGLKRGYDIVVSAVELEDKVKGKLVEMQSEVEIKGFRKGKVPTTLLKKKFGQRLIGEVVQVSIESAVKTHFEYSGDRPVTKPEIKVITDGWKEGGDIHAEMSYETMPEIPEVDLKSIELEKLVAKADNAAIEEALNNLGEKTKNYKSRCKDSKAMDGDQVVFDFISKVDGEDFAGDSVEDYSLVLGSNSFIQGFDEQLVGVKVEEVVDVNITFSAEFPAKNLAGKDAVFTCTIKEVKEPVAFEVDDEFAKKHGAEDLAALKDQIAGSLNAGYAETARFLMKRDLLDVWDESVSFDVPQSMIMVEAKKIAHQLRHEKNPDVEAHDHGLVEPTDEHNKLAERRVRLGLLINELGVRAGIEVTDGELNREIRNQAGKHLGQERQNIESLVQNSKVRQTVKGELMENKVIDYVFELAQVADREVTIGDLVKALEAIEEA